MVNSLKPYYEENGITIYHGDCREILPLLPNVDMVLTDPPYGVGLGEHQRQAMGKHGGGYTFGADLPEYVENVCVPVVCECIRRATRVVLTPGTRCAWKYPEPTTIWSIYCPAGAGNGRWMAFTCWQPVLCYGEGPRRIGSIPDTFVTTEQAEKNGHPCPKPIRLWKQILSAVSNQDDLVLDPFMGSGTTLVAAKQLGRRAIGIELEEKYCAIAVERLRQEVLPFTDRKQAPIPEQQNLLANL